MIGIPTATQCADVTQYIVRHRASLGTPFVPTPDDPFHRIYKALLPHFEDARSHLTDPRRALVWMLCRSEQAHALALPMVRHFDVVLVSTTLLDRLARMAATAGRLVSLDPELAPALTRAMTPPQPGGETMPLWRLIERVLWHTAHAWLIGHEFAHLATGTTHLRPAVQDGQPPAPARHEDELCAEIEADLYGLHWAVDRQFPRLRFDPNPDADPMPGLLTHPGLCFLLQQLALMLGFVAINADHTMTYNARTGLAHSHPRSGLRSRYSQDTLAYRTLQAGVMHWDHIEACLHKARLLTGMTCNRLQLPDAVRLADLSPGSPNWRLADTRAHMLGLSTPSRQQLEALVRQLAAYEQDWPTRRERYAPHARWQEALRPRWRVHGAVLNTPAQPFRI